MTSSSKSRALIVGGSSGIGYSVAEQLLQSGIATLIVGNDGEKLEKARTALSKIGTVEAIQANLYKPSDLAKVGAIVNDNSRHIKYLVNAAGYFHPTAFVDHTEDDYEAYMGLNKAIFFISQAVARNMEANGGGSIVNIGSMWAKQAIKVTPSSAYSMAKAGLHALTQHMAMELADHNIRVNAVSPAVVKTPIYEAFIDPQEMDSALPLASYRPPARSMNEPVEYDASSATSSARPRVSVSIAPFTDRDSRELPARNQLGPEFLQ